MKIKIISLPTMLAATLLLLAGYHTNVQAAITGLSVNVSNDGAGAFDADDNPGNDSTAQNNIVRTHYELRYRVSLTTDGVDTAVIVSIDLPAIPANVGGNVISNQIVGEPLARWQQIPTQCSGPGSALSNDGRTLACDLGDIPNAAVTIIEPLAMVSGQAPNGAAVSLADGQSGTGFAPGGQQ